MNIVSIVIPHIALFEYLERIIIFISLIIFILGIDCSELLYCYSKRFIELSYNNSFLLFIINNIYEFSLLDIICILVVVKLL